MDRLVNGEGLGNPNGKKLTEKFYLEIQRLQNHLAEGRCILLWFRIGIADELAVESPVSLSITFQDLALPAVKSEVPWAETADIKRDAPSHISCGFRQRREKLINEDVGVEIDRFLVASRMILKLPT